MHYTRQTYMRYFGPIDEGYHVLKGAPFAHASLQTLRIPLGVELAIDGVWKRSESRGGISLYGGALHALVDAGQEVALHIRNLTGTRLRRADVRLLCMSPASVQLGRKRLIGAFRIYDETHV